MYLWDSRQKRGERRVLLDPHHGVPADLSTVLQMIVGFVGHYCPKAAALNQVNAGFAVCRLSGTCKQLVGHGLQ